MWLINRGGTVLATVLLLCTTFAPSTSKTTTTTTAIPIADYIYDDYGDGEMGNSGSSSTKAADQVAYGVVSCVTVGVLIVMLYMAIFGRRMRATAIRWHVINCSLWGILHLISYASFAEKAPWPNYIKNEDWKSTSKQVECFTRSVFPAGMVFVYLEQIVLTLAPRLANSLIFNAIFFVLLIPFLNVLMIALYFAHFVDYEWWYEPIDLFNLATYVLFVTFTLIYFIFCLIGTCLCCATISSKKPTSRTTGTYADMWLLFPYGLIPSIMYGPSFGMTSISFALKHLLNLVLESGILDGGGGDTSSLPIDMNTLLQLTTNAVLAMPWFVLLFPLVQSLLTLVCIRMFREQAFFTLSCGRIYDGKRLKIGLSHVTEEWAVGTNGPPPIYPDISTEKPE